MDRIMFLKNYIKIILNLINIIKIIKGRIVFYILIFDFDKKA